MAGEAGGTNPIRVIDDNPMSSRQWIVVVLMIMLNALDGFDVLSSAFASAGISQIELGGQLQMDRATTMTIVNRLQERTYLRRERSESDGRKQALYATDAGLEALAEAKRCIGEHEGWLKARFSPAEIEKLVEMLARIHE